MIERKPRLLKAVGVVLVLAAVVALLWNPVQDAIHGYQENSVLGESIHGRLLKLEMNSRMLHRVNTVFVYLPPGYTKSTDRYPVVYLLHGCPGAGRDWFVKARAHETAERMILTKQIRPLILVSFDGFGQGGSKDHSEFLNSADGSLRVEDYVASELPKSIDREFRTIPSPNARALIGLSSGGYGAVNIGIKHQDVFAVLASHSGYFEPKFEYPYVVKMLGPRGPRWEANNPYKLINDYRNDSRLHIYMDCGKEDELYPENKRFTDELTNNHIGHIFRVTDGGHKWWLWRRQLRYSLAYADTRFEALISGALPRIRSGAPPLHPAGPSRVQRQSLWLGVWGQSPQSQRRLR